MMVPTIHLNGSGLGNLVPGYTRAYEALQAAYDALKQTAPNGRDYYVQGPDAYPKAADEHSARLRRVQEAMDEVEAILVEICQE